MYHPFSVFEETKMKRYSLILLFALLWGVHARAQEVFNQVMNSSMLVLNDPKADALSMNVAQFKCTALQYLFNMVQKQNGGHVDADFLDNQAYSMNQFVTDFLSELNRAKDDGKRKEVMKRYWKASAKNPLFGDKDTETTRAFANDPDTFTPFSLDTNWQLAEKAAEEMKKK